MNWRKHTTLVGMSAVSRQIAITAVVALFVGSAMPQTNPYPKPQVASATGQIAPDFMLKDQDGKDFKLSDQRGHWVLLYFYPGLLVTVLHGRTARVRAAENRF